MIEIEFEEQFPSLKGCIEWKYLDSTDVKWRVVGTYHIAKHCTDNQKIKDAIDKILPNNDIFNSQYIILNSTLKKELGLL